ncbi:MAG: Fic family protein [Vitreimonas sp.]
MLIDLSWNSSRLEGNTYSLLDTLLLLEQGKSAQGKSAEETQMVLNHKDAAEFLIDAANEVGFNRHTILNLHALLSNNLLADPMASGRLRRRSIGIGGSVYEPLQDPHLTEECFVEMLQKADQIADPFEQSLFISIQLPYLQPFEDVNKRVSRLAANIPFVKRNLSPVSFVDVPEKLYIDAMLAVYELNATELARDMFIWAYERSAQRYAAIRQSLGEPDPFRLRYREQLRDVVSRVVRGARGKQDASVEIGAYAASSIPSEERARFVETAETELVGLHEGNFARYRVRPSEYFAWKAAWEAS